MKWTQYMENYLFDMIRNFFIYLYMINDTKKGNNVNIWSQRIRTKTQDQKITARWSFVTTN